MSQVFSFRLPERGGIRVTGSERVRWLDGMLSNDVKALAQAGPGSGCHALLLTHQGRVVADLHVLLGAEAVDLELERSAVAGVIERLDKFIIADDVSLADRSADWERLAVEGEAAAAAVGAAAGAPLPALADHAWVELEIAGTPVRAAAYAFTAMPGVQLFAPAGRGDAVDAALRAVPGVEAGDAALLERLRIEAGTPWLGKELDETVLPAEAGLDDAVSATKGCYTGQEVVARLRTRNRRNHVLMGLRFSGPIPAPGAALESAEGRRVGEVTSTVESPRFGPIGLGYVHHEQARPGGSVRVQGAPATLSALPFSGEA